MTRNSINLLKSGPKVTKRTLMSQDAQKYHRKAPGLQKPQEMLKITFEYPKDTLKHPISIRLILTSDNSTKDI